MKMHEPYNKKFSGLIDAIAAAKAQDSLLLLYSEAHLGDDEEERAESMRRIKEAGVTLEFVKK